MLELSVVAELTTSSDNAQIDKIDEYFQSCGLSLTNQHTILFYLCKEKSLIGLLGTIHFDI